MPRKLLGEITSATELIQLPRQRDALAAAPEGDGHPVVVAPGLLAADRSTWLLRRFLASKGYATTGWGLGRNLGTLDQFDGLRETIERVADEADRRVSVVGWSLGGVAARYAAAEASDSVRQIITLGSPFQVDPRDRAFFPVYSRLSGVVREDFTPERLAAFMTTPTVPTTSIASRDDAIVSLDDAAQPSGPTSETIEIRGSHVGLVRNAGVWRIVADRLAQPEGVWRPFAGR